LSSSWNFLGREAHVSLPEKFHPARAQQRLEGTMKMVLDCEGTGRLMRQFHLLGAQHVKCDALNDLSATQNPGLQVCFLEIFPEVAHLTIGAGELSHETSGLQHKSRTTDCFLLSNLVDLFVIPTTPWRVIYNINPRIYQITVNLKLHLNTVHSYE
jgi:hypothetical protein